MVVIANKIEMKTSSFFGTTATMGNDGKGTPCTWCPNPVNAEDPDRLVKNTWYGKAYCSSCWDWWNQRQKQKKRNYVADTSAGIDGSGIDGGGREGPPTPQLRLRYLRPRNPISTREKARGHNWPYTIAPGEIVYGCGYYSKREADDVFQTLTRENMLEKAQGRARSSSSPITPWSCHHRVLLEQCGKDFFDYSKETFVQRWERDFGVRVLELRVNLYTESDWKPFHQDSHCYHRDSGLREELTIAASFGSTRDLMWRPIPETKTAGGENGTTDGHEWKNIPQAEDLFHLRLEQRAGDLVAFDSIVNDAMEHGIPKTSSDTNCNSEAENRTSSNTSGDSCSTQSSDHGVGDAAEETGPGVGMDSEGRAIRSRDLDRRSEEQFTRISVVAWCARNETIAAFANGGS
ncbi:unnamed protein product [Amoebophrya sp. A25]|nr:unnamed protein product [Amoebophrya sp. A25]|eukprot:GSA25T00015893001.1